MKLTTVLAAVSAAAILPASAVQYSLGAGNFSDAVSDTAITLNDGTPVAPGSGFAGLGWFETAPAGPADVAGSFNSLVSGDMDASSLIGGPLAGFFNFGGDLDSGDAEVIAAGDKQVYLVFGNANDLGDATEVGVLEIVGQTFISDFTGAPPFTTTGIKPDGQTPIVGAFGGGVDLGPASSAASFALAVVPEPSSALLLGFAGLGLLIRRKR